MAMKIGTTLAVGLLTLPAIAGPGDVVIETKTFDLDGGAKLSVDWGTLEVPENRRDPETGTIKIAFARVRSIAEEPGSPLIYLAGGPGGSLAVLLLSLAIAHSIHARGDPSRQLRTDRDRSGPAGNHPSML